MKKKMYLVGALLMTVMLTGCGAKEQKEQTDDNIQSAVVIEDAVKDIIVDEEPAVKTLTPVLNGKCVDIIHGADTDIYYKANITECTPEDFETYVELCKDDFTDIYCDMDTYFLAHTSDQKYQISVNYYEDSSIIFVVTEDIEAANEEE